MSTWWIGRLVHKDSHTSNLWLNQLLVMYICEEFSVEKTIEVETNDQVLIKSIMANKENINVNLKPIDQVNSFSYLIRNKLKRVSKITLSLAREIQTLILLLCISSSRIDSSRKNKDIWFRTLFPINWISSESKNDRLFGNTPIQDQSHGYKSKYLVFISRSKKDLKIGFFNLYKRIKNLHILSKRQIYFPQKLISLKDILEVYLSSYKEELFFRKLSKKDYFKNIFYINDLDLSDILINEWSSIYIGMQQHSKIQGLATSKFFGQIADGQKIITYGEFFSPNRAAYFLTKKIKPNTKFISIQHAMNAKNKTFTYFRRDEFNFEGASYGKKYSPFPDYFLTQGDQYKRILKEFYDKKRIGTIGSLKEIKTNFETKNEILKKLQDSNKKILLLAPSIGNEYETMLSFLKDWKYLLDWKILLSPHPTTSFQDIKKYQEKELPEIDIVYASGISTHQLLTISDAVISCFSTIAIEALIFNVKSIRVYQLGMIPQFDFDERIPTFYDINEFQEWFERQKFEKKTVNADNEIFTDYFHFNDGLAGNRMWKFISSIEDVENAEL